MQDPHAFDYLRFEEVLYHDLHALNRLHMFQRLRNVLQNNTARKLWIFDFERYALMAKAPADVDEERFVGFGGPSADLLFDREDGKPVQSPCTLDHHDLLEIGEALRLVREPYKAREIRIIRSLKHSFAIIGDILVFYIC